MFYLHAQSLPCTSVPPIDGCIDGWMDDGWMGKGVKSVKCSSIQTLHQSGHKVADVTVNDYL